ncbi:MAG: hypothetical protein GTO63_26560 [Anaerolineae bacterium]|nr:hypothetical protein [Anaerolineae bacterium]NIN98295.1 hypothetical protein [Anaerolineae bacterium]NIQ81224.1 hypothetical protein [Anaerolineae bacterium]
MDTGQLHYGELTIKGVFHHTPHTVRKALELLRLGVVKAEPLITGQLSLRDVERALQMVAAGQAIKMAIIP